jgi:Na+/H+-dicarboxylate symporter
MVKNEKTILLILAGLFLFSIVAASVNAQDFDSYYDDAEAFGLFGGLFAGAFCIIWIVILVVSLLIAIWVYKDADKRGSSGALWLIIVIFTGIIGLIIWLVVRPPIGGKASGETSTSSGGSDRRCPNCGRVIPLDANVCPYCKRDFGN